MASIAYVPLLNEQRRLYDQPRGMERFRAYLRTMLDAERGDIALPLMALNPMGKEHVAACLDAYLAMDADTHAAHALMQKSATLACPLPSLRVALVLADDAHGQWTNRYTTEYATTFDITPLLKRWWAVGLLWTSEPPSLEHARVAALTAFARTCYVAQHGVARTLREHLRQEQVALQFAGASTPHLPDDDAAYTRDVLTPLLDTDNYATILVALFGDDAAHALGYPPLGLSPHAGLALARQSAVSVLEW